MVGLRERRHEETRQLLVDVAFGLFADRGFDSVTMEEIAATAGISRSTAYRRFPTKEDVVLEVPRRWLDIFDAAFDALTDDTLVADAVRVTSLAVATHIDSQQEMVRSAYAVLDSSSSLESATVSTAAWLGRLVNVVDRFSDVDPESSNVIAGAYLGAIDGMMQHWATTGATNSVADATARLLDRLEAILP